MPHIIQKLKTFFTKDGYILIESAIVGIAISSSRILAYVREKILSLWMDKVIFDAFIAAMNLPYVIRRVTSEGTVQNAAIPIIAEFKNDEKNLSRWLAQLSLMSITTVGLCILLCVIIITLINFYIIDQRISWCLQFLRILLPTLILYMINSIWVTILISERKFFVASIGCTISNLVVIPALYLAYVYDLSYLWAAKAALCGVCAQTCWTYIHVRRNSTFGRFARGNDYPEQTKRFCIVLYRSFLGAGMSQILIIVPTVLSYFLPVGSLSYLSRSDKMNQIPISLLGAGLSTVLLPTLNKAITNKHLQKAQIIYYIIFGAALIASTIIAFLLYSSALYLANFWQGGKTSLADVAQIAELLQIRIIGLPFFVLIHIINSVYFAHAEDKGKTPLKGSIVQSISDVALSCILVSHYGAKGIAIGSIFCGIMKTLYLLSQSHICHIKLIPFTKHKHQSQ